MALPPNVLSNPVFNGGAGQIGRNAYHPYRSVLEPTNLPPFYVKQKATFCTVVEDASLKDAVDRCWADTETAASTAALLAGVVNDQNNRAFAIILDTHIVLNAAGEGTYVVAMFWTYSMNDIAGNDNPGLFVYP